MEEGLPSQKKNVPCKEVFKDLNCVAGRESPESGSLYSDYESGQQYEDKDLPSGYNSGEQYDTLSTGYMSGEAYELPEQRPEPLEPTLASIDEVSTQSAEDLFTLAGGGVVPGLLGGPQLSQQLDRDSSSSGSQAEQLEIAAALEPLAAQPGLVLQHKAKRKKTVSYHVSVPVDVSPLGPLDVGGYRQIPSDTDTTSCFDSDGTYMRSEGQSSDSGAALLAHPAGRRKGRKATDMLGKAGRKRLRKAKQTIRNNEDFFSRFDNKYWAGARQLCFWLSVLAILASILAAAVLIGIMPRNCDPETAWWQGGVILDLQPDHSAGLPGGEPWLNLTQLIAAVPAYRELGVRAVRLAGLYRAGPGPVWHSLAAGPAVLEQRLEVEQLPVLAATLHQHGMFLLAELPAVEEPGQADPARPGEMSLSLIQNVTKAIKTWAEFGADGLSLAGLESFASDPYIATSAKQWKQNFDKYGVSPNPKILTVSSDLPQRIQQLEEEAATKEKSDMVDLATDQPILSREAANAGIASFHLLDAELDLRAENVEEAVGRAAQWDRAPTQPWLSWALDSGPTNQAQLAFQLLLPGTLRLRLPLPRPLLARLLAIRAAAVPIYMNGNFKTCHGHCDGVTMKEDNYVVHALPGPLLLLERNFNRRNRYMVIANFGSGNCSLAAVSNLYSGGEVILDTRDLSIESEFVKFSDILLASNQALVIKFPK